MPHSDSNPFGQGLSLRLKGLRNENNTNNFKHRIITIASIIYYGGGVMKPHTPILHLGIGFNARRIRARQRVIKIALMAIPVLYLIVWYGG